MIPKAMKETTSDYQQAWETPQRQSLAAIVIILLRSLLQLIKAFWPVLLFYFLPNSSEGSENTEDSNFILIFWSVLLVAAIVLALLRYWFYQFSIRKGHLEIQSGFFQRKQLSIPLQNIQAVHLEQGVWQRLMGVYRVSFDSTGSEGTEARIDALPKQKAAALRHSLLSRRQKPMEDESGKPRSSIQYRLSFGDLVKLSLSANHLEAFLLLAAFGLQLFDDLEPLLHNEQKQALEQYAHDAVQATIWMMGSMLFLLAFISLAISAGRTFLKYHDFHFEEAGDGWRLNFGLITRHQRFTPLNKIQLVHYKANWLRRKINFWMVTLRTIGQEVQQSEVKLTLPTTSLKQAERLASHYLEVEEYSSLPKMGISPAYWHYRLRWIGLIGVVLAIALGFLWHIAASTVVVMLMAYWAGHSYWWHKNFRWAMNERGIWRQTGAWGRQYDLLRWEKVQQVEVVETLYQRRKNLASLRLVTAGGEISLPFLSSKTAHQTANFALYQLETKKLNWL